MHEPLIPKSVFDRVRAVLRGKVNTRAIRHDFLFRRLLSCRHCGVRLVGECQKGHVYYRCHTSDCSTKSLREEAIEDQILEALQPLDLSPDERSHLGERLKSLETDWLATREAEQKTVVLRLGQIQDRLGRITDAYLDGTIEKDLFEERKTTLLLERQELQEHRAALESGGASVPNRLTEFLELAGSAWLRYKLGEREEKRELLQILTSNWLVDGKKLMMTLNPPFDEVAKRAQNTNGDPQRDTLRTLTSLWYTLLQWFKQNNGPREAFKGDAREAV